MIIAYKKKNLSDAKGFQKSIGKKRNKLLEGIITMTIPSVTLKQTNSEFFRNFFQIK